MKALEEYFLMLVFMLLLNRVQVLANVMCFIPTAESHKKKLKFLPFILYWIPLTISAVLYLKQIQDDSKRNVHNRTTECGPLQNDFTLTKCK